MFSATSDDLIKQEFRNASLPRVAVIFHRLGPYHVARLHASAREFSVTSLEMSASDETYAWAPVQGSDLFERATLFDQQDSRREPAAKVQQRVRQALGAISPKAVLVPGWAEVEAVAAVQWCGERHIPAIVMSESTAWDERRMMHKEWVKRRVVRMCSSALAGGEPHADYLLNLGMPRDQIFLGYDAVDNAYFTEKAGGSRKQKAEIAKRYGLPGMYFLASARFVEKKNLGRLLQAYARYRELVSKLENGKRKAETWGVVLLGDGPLKATLDAQLSKLNLRDFVQMPGFKQYDELPVYYGLASAFIHASTTEQWGLVVNEAMASGLPVLVSNRCGCAQDLVKEGVNGFTFDPYNVEELANLMLKLSNGDGIQDGGRRADSVPITKIDLGAMGQASQRIISAWGPERFSKGLLDAVELALRLPLPKVGLLDKLLLKLLLLRS